MSKELYLVDYLTYQKPRIYTDALNLLQDLYSQPSSYNLSTYIRATHSGYLLNGRVYPGLHMKNATTDWYSQERGGTASYDKPVLTHHSQHDGEPIGRVIGAEFTQLKDESEFDNDWRSPESGTNLGSGFITLQAQIGDKDAMEKISDGRYLTVSTGQRTNKAICSVCGEDWLKDSGEGEICEHRPGRYYNIDGSSYRCYLVTGPLTYHEVSYVNVPAQPNARTVSASANSDALEAAIEGSRDSSLTFSATYDRASVSSIVLSDSQGNNVELIVPEGGKDELPDEALSLQTKTSVSVPENVTDESAEDSDVLVEPTEEASKMIEKTVVDDSEVDSDNSDQNGENSDQSESDPEEGAEGNSDDESTISDEHLALMNVAKSIIEAGLLDTSEDGDDSHSVAEIKKLANEFDDAKLSTAQRKRLEASTFCGPNRSFPVPDCAHVTAAKRLIGRAKVSSETKSRIIACVNRKSNKLSCGSAEDHKDGTCELILQPKEAQMPNDERQISGYALEEALESVSSAKADLEEKLRRLQSTLDAKTELCERLTEENGEIRGKLVEQAAHQLAIMRVNLGKPGTITINNREKLDVYVEDLSSRSLDSLNDSINDLLPEVELMLKERDHKSNSSKLQDVSVEDPTLVHPSKDKSTELRSKDDVLKEL